MSCLNSQIYLLFSLIVVSSISCSPNDGKAFHDETSQRTNTHQTEPPRHIADAVYKEPDTTLKPNQNTDIAYIYGASSGAVSDKDVALALQWGNHGRSWNKALTPFWRDYIDETVPAQQWVSDSKYMLQVLGIVLLDMSETFHSFEDEGIRNTLKPLLDIHSDMFHNYKNLRKAVEMGEPQLEQKHYGLVKALGDKKMKLALPIVERLRESMDKSVLEPKIEEMKAEIIELYLE